MQLDNIYVQLKNPTNSIKAELLQGLVIAVKKSDSNGGEIIDLILKELWTHLRNKFTHFDDQLLCATTFFSVLCVTDSDNNYITEVESIVNKQLEAEIKERKPVHAISLIYGMFQSSYFLSEQLIIKNIEKLKKLLQSAFDLLVHIAYEYSQYTFIAFKIMSSFKKVIGTNVQNIIFHKDNQIRLLKMVIHNWENPITGVRNLNRTIFRHVLSVLNNETYEVLLYDINNIYWNKAKYLMLAEIIEIFDGNIEALVTDHHWVDGILSSLHKPGLVSAGSDMYFAILKKLNNENAWKSLYFTRIINILCGQQQKAIENFSNYWCLATFKKFPTLLLSMIEELKKNNESETVLYSYLCLLKHGCKLGIVKKNWGLPTEDSEMDMTLESLRHCKPCLRILSFEILCATDKVMPAQLQYEYILQFLWENINSDCTVLRLSMLNNLATFITKLHVSFLQYYKDDVNDSKIMELLSFCKDLQNFIIKSFKYDGNYQRKITTVNLTQIILKNFNNVHHKNKDTKKADCTLMNLLKMNRCWYLHEKDFLMTLIYLLKDPANDVHENVSQILLVYYIEEICDTSIFNCMIDDAIMCINSKFFYEISCGQLIFKLIANILLKVKVQTKFKQVEDIFHFAFNVLKEQYNSQNIVVSIENGKQLHSYINIIYVTLQACLQQSYNIQIPNETIQTLVTMLEFISNQFAWENETKSSDFSRMNDMVQSLIIDAGYDTKNEDDETKTSGQYQLVLNCLWLNVKASCDLSSLLIQYNIDVGTSERCLKTITNVLETSRHKGAIEAAGVAIGTAIRYLTGLPENNELYKLPLTLLEKKLNELIFEASKTSSITRRGAGLSIMVHRIVSSDMSKGKPLFHYFMKLLLSTCNSNELTNDVQNVNKEDLPKAVYIHFMTRVVMDSSLASDMMFYATELGDMAFQNLADEHWQIRNAALQLYGALIPKLMGQKKSCGMDEETVTSVACDEFKTHFPTLWTYILQRVKVQDSGNKLQAHSNLIPILNILANMGKRYTLSCDFNQPDLNLLSVNLLQLLDSPIYVVRRLTSKAIANIFAPAILEQFLKANTYFSENFRHGILLLVSEFKKYKDKIHNQEVLGNILNPSQHSFLCKLYYDDMFGDDNYNVDTVISVLNVVNSSNYYPGVYLWANNTIEKYIKKSSWDNIPQLLKLLVNYNEFENCCRMLHERMEKDNNVPTETMIEITTVLLNTKKYNSCISWKLLYHISQKCSLLKNLDIVKITEHLHSDNIYRIRYIIPLAARICAQKRDNHNLLHISNIIFNLSNPETSDVDMRYIAAKANNEIAYEFMKLSDNIKMTGIKIAIILLQDEDEDVRHLSCRFYSYAINEKKMLNPFICLNKILHLKFMQSSFKMPNNCAKTICEDISKLIKPTARNESNRFNPFACDSKNIYMENNVLRELIENLTCSNYII